MVSRVKNLFKHYLECITRMGAGISKEVFILVLFADDFVAKNGGRPDFQNGKKNALFRPGNIRG